MKRFLRDRRLNLVLRFVIGGLFFYAAFEKVLHPAAFAMAVRGYKLIPFSLSNLFAIAVSWSEIVAATFLILGILNYAIPFALFPFAEQTVASSIVGVINGMTPMTTVIVSQLWPGGEKATWNKVVGVAIGFAGAVILSLPSLGVGASAQVIGLLAAFVATLC